MTDYLQVLVNKIKENYINAIENDEIVQKLFEKCLKSDDYTDGYYLAKYAGRVMESKIKSAWTAGEKVYFGTLVDLLNNTLPILHKDVARACVLIQKNKNANEKMLLRPQITEYIKGDAIGIAEYMSGKMIESLNDKIETYACKVVDDIMTDNIMLRTGAGIPIVVTRVYDGVGLRAGTDNAEPCQYCIDLARTPFYFTTTREARNSSAFSRHNGCGCTINYKKGDGSINNTVNNYKQGIKKPIYLNGTAENVEHNLEKARFRDIIVEELGEYTGKSIHLRDEAHEKYSQSWPRASLKEALKKFVPNSNMTYEGRGKITYSSEQSKYEITYDIIYDYFRIKDISLDIGWYVDINGNDVRNYVDSDGITHGRKGTEQKLITHIKNTDWRDNNE